MKPEMTEKMRNGFASHIPPLRTEEICLALSCLAGTLTAKYVAKVQMATIKPISYSGTHVLRGCSDISAYKPAMRQTMIMPMSRPVKKLEITIVAAS